MRYLTVRLFCGLAVAVATLPAQIEPPPFSCIAQAGGTPTIRTEGVSELVGDVVLNCTGGTPVAAGTPVPAVNLQVFFNSNVTSRLLSDPWTEALLLLDDPQPGNQLPCTASGGRCQILGNGTGEGLYDGSPGHPNVFQGRQTGANSITWFGVPVAAPGSAGNRIMRLTNVRANQSAARASGQPPTQVISTISASSGGTPIPISNPTQVVAFVQRGLSFSVRDKSTVPHCQTLNPGLLQATPSGTAGPQFLLRYSENFPTAFRARGSSAQNIPGTSYGSESGFHNPQFPGDLGQAGGADHGTRLIAAFRNVPAGVKLFASTIRSSSSSPGFSAELISSETGPFLPVTPAGTVTTNGLPVPIAPVTLTNGAGSVAWEVTETGSGPGSLDFPIYVAYSSGGTIPTSPLAPSTLTVTGSFAPLSTVVSGQALPIPRFADRVPGIDPSGTTFAATTIASCSGATPTLGVLSPTGAPLPGFQVFSPTSLGPEFPINLHITSDTNALTPFIVPVITQPQSPTGNQATAGWLTVTPTPGQTPVTATVEFDPAGLAPGNYDGSIQITASGATNPAQAIPIRLTVRPPGPSRPRPATPACFSTGRRRRCCIRPRTRWR